ncbi:hypothetical protein FSP39_023555 [Pinctada imbricata]|uniref:Poly [ADP-ribose] polymerase n=1 Tax=Pinctada imbricata TaxID=66713 RepID=A0AA88XPI7_PINIB|nr:hypothetical protein FSP39_023555 [Pinctada imbricata]
MTKHKPTRPMGNQRRLKMVICHVSSRRYGYPGLHAHNPPTVPIAHRSRRRYNCGLKQPPHCQMTTNKQDRKTQGPKQHRRAYVYSSCCKRFKRAHLCYHPRIPTDFQRGLEEIKLPSSSKHMNEETDVFRSDSSPGTKEVKVRNLPPATSEESLKEFLQQETSVKIETVALDSRNKAAIVTLQSPKDTDVLMKSIRTDLTLSMRGKRKLYELEFEAIASESESESEEEPDDMISDTIYLSDLPSGTTEKKLKTFLERMSGSGTVQSLNYNAISHSAQVTFTSHDCVKTVMSKVPLKFQKMLIGVSYYETDVDKEIAGNEVEPQWIEVKDIPSDVTESQLRRFFEKDDISNGGKVESCYYNDRTGHAYIAFTEPADYSFTCRISELPKDTTEKELQAFFFKGTGFDRPEVELHEEFHVAFLTVKDFKAAAKILQKEIYDLKGTKIKAERYVSELDEDNLSDEYVPQQVVRISQLPLNVSAEDITRYFSNKRLSGGGPIMNLKLIPILQKAYIQFQLKQDADEIIKRKFHTVKNGNVLAERTDFLFEDEDEIETREMSCTIVVRVGSDTVTQDFLDEVRSYFDNESLSGGTELQTFDDVSTDEILLTYRNTKVAQDVATRSHIVGERKLNVELYRPTKGKPKVDEQHILLSELPSACTCEDVKDFVHSNVKRVVQNVRLQIENSMAIVRFMDGIDIATALENIRGKCLKQKVIRVDALPRTSSIQVTGFVEEIQELQVKKYFENETESGGGDIVSIEFLQEDMSYIVTFENHNVLSRLHQTHVLNGEVILVQPFFECLKETPSFKKPDETQIPCDADIYDFLFKNEKFKEELSMSVTKSCFGKIKWKSTPASSITVECILEKSVPNCRNIAKTWEEDVTKLAKAFLEKFDSFTFTLLQEVWDVSFTKLGSINKKEDVVIEMKKHDRVVSVYGVRAKVRELAAELRKLIQDEEEKIEHKKKSITETLQLRKSDLFLLQNSDSMNEITKKMSISEAGKDTITVKLTGNPKAVQESVEEIKVFLKGIYHAENTRISMLLLDFLETKRAKSHLNAILIENKVTCYWERRNASVHIFGADRSSTDKFMKIFDEVFEEMCYEIPTDSVQEFRSTKWEKYSEELKSKLDGDVIFCYLDTFVVISGIRGKCNRAREEIIEYGRRNTKIKATLTVEKHISRYLEIAKPLATIENRCTLWLDTSKHMLTVEETKENIKETTDNIDEILSAVKVERYQVRKPGIAKFLLSTNGKKLIDEVAESNKVSISEGDSKGFKSIDLNQPQIKAQCTIKSKPSVIILEGDLFRVQADIFVNPNNQMLDLDVGISCLFKKYGGNKLVRDCREFSGRNMLLEGDVYMGEAGDLKCYKVMHAVRPQWHGGDQKERHILVNLVYRCLEEAAENGYKSIAFPPLCVGKFAFPDVVATSSMIKGINEFLERKGSFGSLSTIFVIGNKSLVVDYFIKFLREEFPSDMVYIPEIHKKPSWEQEKHETCKENVVTFGSISIEVKFGSILEQEVEAIVNTTGLNADLQRGYVSRALLHRGGEEIQRDLKRSCIRPLKFFDILRTSGGKLKIKNILHGVLPPARNEENARENIQNFVTKCLEEADDANVKTLAFPALGTGKLGYPEKIVAEKMFEAIKAFSERHKKTSITKVKFVIYEEDIHVLMIFKDIEKQHHSTSNESPFTARVRRQLVNDKTSQGLEKKETHEFSFETVSLVFTRSNIISSGGDGTRVVIVDSDFNLKGKEHIRKGKIICAPAPSSMQYRKLMYVLSDDAENDIDGTLTDILREVQISQTPCITLAPFAAVHDFVKCLLEKTYAFCNETKQELKIIVTVDNDMDLRQAVDEVNQSNMSNKGLRRGLIEQNPTPKAQYPSRREPTMHESIVTLLIVGESLDSTQNARSSLDAKIRAAYTQKTIDDNIISTLSEEQIFRIQNPSLFRSFEIKKNEFQRIYTSREPVKQLWHGTTANTIQQINRRGFNRNFCGKNATSYGEGVYFAKSSSYSIKDKYSVPDENGYKYVYLCDVLVGKYTKGSKGLRDPPAIDERHQHIRYDSVVDREQDPSLFVIFHDTQAYPKYLIKFRVEIM